MTVPVFKKILWMILMFSSDCEALCRTRDKNEAGEVPYSCVGYFESRFSADTAEWDSVKTQPF